MDSEEVRKLGKILSSPLSWAEALLKDPASGENFKANYLERKILSCDEKRIVIRAHRRGGKAIPLTATVYTPSGPVTMGEISLGSTVCTPNGESAVVTGVYPQGKKSVYRLYLDDGTYVDSCKDHLWEVYTGLNWRGRKKNYGNKIVTTEEIVENLTYTYKDSIEFSYKLNGINPVLFSKRELPIDPYLLGVLLGNGNLDSYSITSNDVEIIKKIEGGVDFPISKRTHTSAKADSYHIKKKYLCKELEYLGLTNKKSHTKFIPTDYLYSSVSDRLELLRGLMDTNGSAIAKRKGQAEYCSVSRQLADDVAELCRSLGCKVRVKESECGYTKNGVRNITGTRFRLRITVPESLEIFSLPRKKCGGLPARYLRRTIVRAEKLDKVEMQCITVDHLDHLYITNNYTPTHNSYSMAVLALWAASVHKYYDVLIACPDDDKVAELFEVINEFINATSVLSDALMERTKSPHLIKFKNGSTIKGRTTGTGGNKEGRALRGKGANLVLVDEAAYLQDGDFKALTPIILGDKYKNSGNMEVRAVIGSTPAEQKGRFFEWCSDTSGQWYQIHIPITENPDFTEEDIDERRSLSTDMEFTCEYLAEFLEAGFSAFRVKDIERAKVDYRYADRGSPRGSAHRAMGVDWDKYQAGVNICIVELMPGQTKYRLIYREEVPRSDYTLTNSVKRVIALNESFDPEFIYVDRGYGEHAVEELRLYGKNNLSSGLSTKVIGFNFNENVTINDPVDGKPIKKQFKTVMVNTMLKLLEDGYLEISSHDRIFDKQLKDYKIVGMGSSTIRTTRKNEHIIDACGLACYAIHSHYQDKLQYIKATKSYAMPIPKTVPSKKTLAFEKDLFRGMRGGMTDKKIWSGFSRGSIGDTSRSSF